jgi:toxin YhaV
MPLVVNGWILLYHPLFGRRYTELRSEARRLKRQLPAHEFRQRPLVKLVAAVHRLITQIVPADPNAPGFRLRGELAKFRRAKGRGLPPRYRLFWVFSEQAHTIVFLYLNDESTLRKEGAGTDPYEVFRTLVQRGELGDDFQENLRRWRQAHPPAAPTTQ